MATFACSSSGNEEETKSESVKSFVDHFLQTGGRGICGCGTANNRPTITLAAPLATMTSSPSTNIGSETALNNQQASVFKERSNLPLKSLKELIKDGQLNLNEPEAATDLTLLMYLCFNGREDFIKLALKKGADPTLRDRNGWSSLHYAVWGQSIRCVKAVLSTGPAGLVNAKNIRGVTPLMISVYRCGLNITQLLIKKGADPFITDNHKRTLIHWAIAGKQVTTLQYLFDKYFTKQQLTGGNQQSEGSPTRYSPDSDNASPLHYATCFTSPTDDGDILTLLLNQGFDLLLFDTATPTPTSDPCPYPALIEGLTPIHWACTLAHIHVVDKLLEHDREVVHVLSRQRLTPLHIAACIGAAELCKRLIENGAKVNVADDTGMTPLHYACHYGHIECVRLLLDDERANVNASTHGNMCGLHLASKEGHSDVVDYLVGTGGADRDRVSGSDGNCAIHLGAISGRHEVIQSLINRGCSAGLVRDSDGRSSLHLSACNGHLDCCRILIDNGAQVNERDKSPEGYGPLDLAWLGNHTHCCEYLLSHGARSCGGVAHRAACTIQLSWQYYVHKRRKRVTRDWASRVIQYSFREWSRREMARRVWKRRERKRQHAAITIQRKWRQYWLKKKELEESYEALMAKIKTERFAARLILSELNFSEASINLPSNVPEQSHSHYRQPHSYTSSLLRSSIEPAPIYPNESLLYEQQAIKPRSRKVRINTVPVTIRQHDSSGHRMGSQTTATNIRGYCPHQFSTNEGNQLEHRSATNSQISQKEDDLLLVNIEDNSNESICTTNERNSHGNREASTEGVRLPAIGKPSHQSQDLQGDTGTRETRGNHTSSTDFTLPRIVNEPLVVTRPSLKSKEERDAAGITSSAGQRRRRKNTGDKNRRSSRSKESKEKIEDKHSSKVKKPVDDTKLLLSAQRYQKLQQVATLLEQAKDIQSTTISGDDEQGYDELKSQIKTALEEAVKLRADTEAICDNNKS